MTGQAVSSAGVYHPATGVSGAGVSGAGVSGGGGSGPTPPTYADGLATEDFLYVLTTEDGVSYLTAETAPTEPWPGYFTAAGITNPAAQNAINDFYGGLNTDGIQSKVKVFVILGGETATAINVMQDAYHGSLVNDPTFSQWVGVRSDGSMSYVSTGTALNALTGYTLNSGCIGIFTKQDNVSVGCDYLNCESYDTYEACAINPVFDGLGNYEIYYAVNDGWGSSSTGSISAGDLDNIRLYASRTGASAMFLKRDAAELATSTEASVSIPTQPMFIAAYNGGGTPSWNAGADTFDAWGYMIAEGLSGAETALLDARVATLRTALEAL